MKWEGGKAGESEVEDCGIGSNKIEESGEDRREWGRKKGDGKKTSI